MHFIYNGKRKKERNWVWIHFWGTIDSKIERLSRMKHKKDTKIYFQKHTLKAILLPLYISFFVQALSTHVSNWNNSYFKYFFYNILLCSSNPTLNPTNQSIIFIMMSYRNWPVESKFSTKPKKFSLISNFFSEHETKQILTIICSIFPASKVQFKIKK